MAGNKCHHSWTYKSLGYLGGGEAFLVCCPDCGKEDQLVHSEREADERAHYLRRNPQSHTLAQHFPRRAF